MCVCVCVCVCAKHTVPRFVQLYHSSETASVLEEPAVGGRDQDSVTLFVTVQLV